MEEIYIKYSKLVYKYLYNLTKNAELSEELMQETFYSAIKGIKNFRYECSIFSWLCEISKNKLKDYWRKNNKIQVVQFDENINKFIQEDNIEEDIFSKIESIELYNEIKTLDEKAKKVVYLRINENLSFKEIAKILNESEAWARTTFYRSKLKLKERLNNEGKM